MARWALILIRRISDNLSTPVIQESKAKIRYLFNVPQISMFSSRTTDTKLRRSLGVQLLKLGFKGKNTCLAEFLSVQTNPLLVLKTQI